LATTARTNRLAGVWSNREGEALKAWRGLITFAAPILLAAQSPDAANISQEHGFSVHESVAEAGLHPDQPAPDTEKVLTNEGHAYWLRSAPLMRGGISDVAVVHDGGQVYLVLKFTPRGGETFSHLAKAHQEQFIAFVLDGKMLGEPMEVLTASDKPTPDFSMLVRSDLEAEVLAFQFKRALEPAEPVVAPR
jgi:hypothetical protein